MEGFYDSLDIHRLMLRDDIRNRAYRDALRATVKPGDVVLDFGAGTGILSLFASQAGAVRVFAVERTSVVHLAREIVARNGLADHITVMHGDIVGIQLPQQVDVLVSEWLGTFGVDENMLAPLLVARDRWLKPGGKMLPGNVTAWMAPLWNSELDFDLSLSRGRLYGLDLQLVAEQTAQEVTWARQPLKEVDLMAAPQPMWVTEVYSYPTEKARLPFRASLSFTAARSGKVNALTAWFTAEFGAGIRLTNSPAAPQTHWGQYLLPLRATVQVTQETPIKVEFTCIPVAPGYCAQAWSVRIGGGPWEHHDTRRSPALAGSGRSFSACSSSSAAAIPSSFGS